MQLGGAAVVRSRDIIGIFDLDYCSTSARTREYLKKAQLAGEVVNTTEEIPKSFVACEDEKGVRRLYISGVSTATLKKRAASGADGLV